MKNHGLINLLAAQAAPESDAQIKSCWRSEAKSSDALKAAIARYGLKNLEENRRNEMLELVETMRPFLDQHLSPFMKRVKIKGKRTQQAYAADVAKFRRYWADTAGLSNISLPIPADLIAIYICCQAQEGASYAAISKIVTAIEYAHRIHEEYSPIRDSSIKAALKYAASMKGSKPVVESREADQPKPSSEAA